MDSGRFEDGYREVLEAALRGVDPEPLRAPQRLAALPGDPQCAPSLMHQGEGLRRGSAPANTPVLGLLCYHLALAHSYMPTHAPLSQCLPCALLCSARQSSPLLPSSLEVRTCTDPYWLRAALHGSIGRRPALRREFTPYLTAPRLSWRASCLQCPRSVFPLAPLTLKVHFCWPKEESSRPLASCETCGPHWRAFRAPSPWAWPSHRGSASRPHPSEAPPAHPS